MSFREVRVSDNCVPGGCFTLALKRLEGGPPAFAPKLPGSESDTYALVDGSPSDELEPCALVPAMTKWARAGDPAPDSDSDV